MNTKVNPNIKRMLMPCPDEAQVTTCPHCGLESYLADCDTEDKDFEPIEDGTAIYDGLYPPSCLTCDLYPNNCLGRCLGCKGIVLVTGWFCGNKVQHSI